MALNPLLIQDGENILSYGAIEYNMKKCTFDQIYFGKQQRAQILNEHAQPAFASLPVFSCEVFPVWVVLPPEGQKPVQSPVFYV